MQFNQTLSLLTVLLCLAGGPALGDDALLPSPLSERLESGAFTVTAATAVEASADPGAEEARHYFLDLMTRSGALPLQAESAGAIRFHIAPGPGNPESYRIAISSNGVEITAPAPAGLFYGGISLWELLSASPGQGPVRLAGRVIEDSPRFGWRGVLLDSARHYQSPETVKRFIDWMALHKLNRLQWHLTDDQGWRIEIKRYPRLTEIGGWHGPSDGIYSQEQIQDIVAFARARHVEIVPEIEMPGHATAAIAAYPQLGSSPNAPAGPSKDWGILPSILNLDDSTFDFLDNVLLETMELFPGQIIHIGGDEAVKTQWKASPSIQASMKSLGIADEDALQGWFTARIGQFLASHGRRLMGWDEILSGGMVGKDAIAAIWHGPDLVREAVGAGHEVVVSQEPTLYFDYRQKATAFEPPGRGTVVRVEDVLAFDPLPAGLSEAEKARILGVQASLWSENFRTDDILMRMAFPRLAALAEIAWSPASDPDPRAFAGRLRLEEQRYRRLGIPFDLPARSPEKGRIYSQSLAMCSVRHPDGIEPDINNLEADTPAGGPRSVFLLDLAHPCWILPDAKIAGKTRIRVGVGHVPFNYQDAKDGYPTKIGTPRTKSGELEIRDGSCGGDPVAVLPLPEAVNSPGTTILQSELPLRPGRRDLCFSFTGRTLNPLWAIDWVEMKLR